MQRHAEDRHQREEAAFAAAKETARAVVDPIPAPAANEIAADPAEPEVIDVDANEAQIIDVDASAQGDSASLYRLAVSPTALYPHHPPTAPAPISIPRSTRYPLDPTIPPPNVLMAVTVHPMNPTLCLAVCLTSGVYRMG
jgi:hypothetical protein